MNRIKTSAVIVAAGSGKRMGSVAKPLIKLGGTTVFERVVAAFNAAKHIDEIIIVCKDEAQFLPLMPKNSKPTRFVLGGETRDKSVCNGVLAAAGSYICVHDCARPFIKSYDIDRVVAAAHEHGAACACACMKDTVKYIDREGGLIYSPNRDFLYALQTPQVFKKDMYITAYAMKNNSDIKTTDETAILENAGFSVEYIDIGGYNFKLTDADDVVIAKAIVFLEGRK